LEGIANYSNPGPGRIIAAVFGLGVKGGADHFACPASMAFINIYLYGFNRFGLLFIAQGLHPPL
jgi:hypothetical protein